MASSCEVAKQTLQPRFSRWFCRTGEFRAPFPTRRTVNPLLFIGPFNTLGGNRGTTAVCSGVIRVNAIDLCEDYCHCTAAKTRCFTRPINTMYRVTIWLSV